jgi:hypothetical protein
MMGGVDKKYRPIMHKSEGVGLLDGLVAIQFKGLPAVASEGILWFRKA